MADGVEVGERLARAEQRLDNHEREIGRLRDGHSDFRETLGIVSAQVGALAAEVKTIAGNTELIAERAAHKVLTAFLQSHRDDNESNNKTLLLKALLAALVLLASALGLKAGNIL